MEREHLEKCLWKKPTSYAGFNPVGDYLIAGQHRESEIVTQHNYSEIFQACKTVVDALPEALRVPEASLAKQFAGFGVSDTDTCREGWFYEWEASCSMVGWHRYLMLRHDAPDVLKNKVEELLAALDAYPILNDDGYSDKVYNAIGEYWAQCSESEREHFCKEAGVELVGEEMPQAVEDYFRDGGMFQ